MRSSKRSRQQPLHAEHPQARLPVMTYRFGWPPILLPLVPVGALAAQLRL
jgi:hypothetical protein